MKPIKLKIEGLQSFREAQVIDFEALTSAGVFGIFGPTGSGKSTILDAITLALYGRVERAHKKNNRGILNLERNRLHVEFTFQLGEGGGKRRIRIERSYISRGDNSLHTSTCRLVEETPAGDVVLADKVGDINREISAILGLNGDDFTRAVVLPQGKFAEFLVALQPAERRQMLQRLFSLHLYGDRLNRRLKDRLNRTAAELAHITGEQAGLGDASAEILAGAEEQLKIALAGEKEAAAAREEAQKEYEQKKRKRQHQEELEAILEKKASLAGREAEIKMLEQKLDGARRAEPLRDSLLQLERVENEMEEKRALLAGVKTAAAAAVQAALAADAAFSQASEKQKREEQGLREKEKDYNLAVELEREISTLNEALLEEEKEVKRQAKKAAECRETLDACFKELEKEREKARETDKELASLFVDSSWREKVSAALEALKEYERAEKDLKEREKRYDVKKQTEVTAAARLEQTGGRVKELEDSLKTLKQRYEELATSKPVTEEELEENERILKLITVTVTKIAGLEEERSRVEKQRNAVQEEVIKAQKELDAAGKQYNLIRSELAALSRNKEAAEKELEACLEKQAAASLAGTLAEGVPCPVCGSLEHPSPAEGIDQASIENKRRLAEELAAREKEKRESLDEAGQLLASAQTRLEAKINSLKLLAGELADKERMLGKAFRELPEGFEAGPPAALRGRFRELERAEEEKRQSLKTWRESREDLKDRLDALTAELSKAAVERSGAEGILQGARKALEEEQKALEAARETLCQKNLELKRCGGDMTGTEIREKAAEIRSKDNRTAIMKKTYEKIKEKVTCLEEDYQKIKENQTSLLLGLHSLEGKINTIREDLKSREEKLKSLTGGYAAQELLGKVREQIRALKDNVEKAAAVRDKKAKEREKAAQNLAEVQAAYTALQDNKTRLSEVIDARVRKNLFASRIEAREALLPGPEQEALEREISKYREERTRLQLEQKRLEEILGEERITKESWLILEEEFSRLKLEAEKARENRVRAEKDLEDLKDKHARWQELEKERKKMVERQEKLEDLKRLFAGNAFVEYVAEEKLASVALEASSRLGSLTRHRYALEVDGEGGFVIRDDANGGLRRPVNSLSGGETFLASLALALALSTQVQLKGRYPLEFFFLDEGFGSLDQETLELALNTLEKLRLEQLTVGVISHVPEIRARLPRRLIVEPPRPGVYGTRVRLEQA